MGRETGRPLTRWTADTEVAFLLALRLTGSVRAACAAIGRSTNGACCRRRRMPAFAARWQAVLDEKHWEWLAAEKARRLRGGEIAPGGGGGGGGGEGDGAAMPNRVRYDGWTPLRQRAFLRALAETGGYEAACRAVGISAAAARVMRRRYPSFGAACERALARADGTLEQIAFERAVEGWDEPIVHAGKVVGQRRRYSDALLRLMIQQEAKRAAARAEAAEREAAKPRPRVSAEEVNELLAAKLDALAMRNRAAERARQIAWADEMVRRGLAP